MTNQLPAGRACLVAVGLLLSGNSGDLAWSAPASRAAKPPLVIQSQGNRAFGGRVIGDLTSSSLHCDHGYADWQIPVRPRRFPLVMVHASSKRSWMTTWDGKEGFRDLMLRRGYPVYLTDLPRTGQAGQACEPYRYEPELNDQRFTNIWRTGLWSAGQPGPTYWPGSQMPTDPESFNQFLRVQTPEFNTPANENVEADALGALLDEIGPAVLVTHSSSGIRGWRTAFRTANVKAIVSYESALYVFPEGELPAPIPLTDGTLRQNGREVPLTDFMKLTKFPVQIVWGDYIPMELDPVNVGPRFPLDSRRAGYLTSKAMADAINRHGGDAQVLHLTDLGITGNSHYPMTDSNAEAVAQELWRFLQKKGLDARGTTSPATRRDAGSAQRP